MRPPRPCAVSVPIHVTGTLDDGQGKAAFSLDVGRVPAGLKVVGELQCPAPYDDCSITQPGPGWTLVLVKGYEYPDKRVLTKFWRASLIGPNGERLHFGNWNSAQQNDAPITRTDPPLGFEQLPAVATSPSWQPLFDRIPKPKPFPPSPAAQPGGDEILRVAAGLLPNGLTEMDTRAEKSTGIFNVDDGKGKAMVSITVQKDPSGDPAWLPDDAETLPDGSWLVVRQVNGTTAQWVAQVLRPDGTLVEAEASNMASQKAIDPAKPPTRSTPALTMDQLKAIAENPIWSQHNGTQQ